jgi:ATP-dependent exoDNAse (exonuclease V) alpha subunit
MAGHGKTTKVKEEANYDKSTTITNICCRMIGSQNTLYSILNLFDTNDFYKNLRKYKNSTIWIDEFSMIPRIYYGFIFCMAQHGCKFIFSGDINQIPPVNEEPVNLKSWFLKKFFKKVEPLNTNYRNDPKLVELSLKALKGDKLKDKSINKPIKDCKVHLCYTHKYKNHINRKIVESKKLKWKDIGTRIIFKNQQKKNNIFKNEVYEIKKRDGNRLILHSVFYDKTKSITVDEKALKHADWGYALTIHSVQGLTIREPYYVHEGERLTNRLFYTPGS